MGCVYRYTDLNDNIIKYVGISKNKRSLINRITNHQSDYWYSFSDKWKIEFIDLGEVFNAPSRTDMEYFEAHLINLYETGKYGNKKHKVGWGVSNLLPEIKDDMWEPYIEGYVWKKFHKTFNDFVNNGGDINKLLNDLERKEKV